MDMVIDFVVEWDTRMAWVSALLWLSRCGIVTRLGWHGITELGVAWEVGWSRVGSTYLVCVVLTSRAAHWMD